MLQARRLGTHLYARADAAGPIAHVFSSDLQRAADTATAILDAQRGPAVMPAPVAALVKVPDLRERDFLSLEGQRYGARSGSGSSAFESFDEMKVRVDRFVETHLHPVLDATGGSVVIVAHGIILGVLLRSLLARFAPVELARLSGPPLPAWSNTGYLEALVQRAPTADRERAGKITMVVLTVNCLDHLKGLKKTRGGIGSTQFDRTQRTLDSFFGPASKRGEGSTR